MEVFSEFPDTNVNPGFAGDPLGGEVTRAIDGPPSLPLASMVVALLALKFLTESNLVSFQPQELKVSAHNIINVGVQAVVFILFLKLGSAYLIKQGISVPGLKDLALAI